MNWSGKKVVVTGGCGFIGSHLVRKLLDLGAAEVIALDSLEYGSEKNLEGADMKRAKIAKFKLGTDNTEGLRGIMSGASHLFHYAAEKHNQSKHAPQRVMDANVKGTLDILQAAVEAKTEKVVFASSLYAYGRMKGGAFLESEHPQPQTVYGISKLTGEQLVEFYAKTSGISMSVVRFLFVYGPRQYAGQGYKSVIVKSLTRMANGEAPIINGDGEQVLDYIYVDDAIRASLAVATDKRPFDIYNVGSGHGISVNNLTRMFFELVPKSLAPIPGEADFTAGSTRVGNVQKIQSQLGFKAETPLSLGLKNTFEWLQGERA